MNIRRSGGTLAVLSALAFFALAPRPAHAQLVMTTTPSSTSAGGTGTLDVTLTNTGLTASNIGGFTFEVSAGSGITFTNAGFSTTSAPYIFAGNSFDTDFSVPLNINTLPDTSVLAGDVGSAAFSFTTLNPGDTYGLGELTYLVDPNASLGPVTVTFESIGLGTSLADGDGNNVTFTANNGSITILPASISTPEPSQITVFALFGIGLGGLLLRARKRSNAV